MVDEIQQFDICIICAKAEEAEAVIDEFSDRLEVHFAQGFSRVNGFEYQYTTINYKEREPLTVLVSWMAFTGPTQTINGVRSLLEEFRPRFVAMTGICAGYEKKVALGDLIAVPYAFYSEEGKVETGRDGQDRLRPEWKSHRTAERIVQYINKFSSWKTPVTENELESSRHLCGR
jgi:nucleoside phosphorylase